MQARADRHRLHSELVQLQTAFFSATEAHSRGKTLTSAYSQWQEIFSWNWSCDQLTFAGTAAEYRRLHGESICLGGYSRHRSGTRDSLLLRGVGCADQKARVSGHGNRSLARN